MNATVEAIAQRVADLLAEHAREPFRLLDTQAVARMLAVSDEWVRGARGGARRDPSGGQPARATPL